jgi:NAD(P)-dependent dehydrogenase (short-subunit alcohol dehydrogenase family)
MHQDTPQELTGRVALVTGAGRGLGYAAADALARSGARIAVVDVSAETASQAAADFDAISEAEGYTLDVSDAAAVSSTVGAVAERFGTVDILVHCAGISRGSTQKDEEGNWLPMESVPESDWHQVIETNLSGTFFMNQAVAKLMIAQNRGRIVNVASMSALVANKGLVGLGPYSASKGGIVSLSTVLAVEWAQYNITVNCISPGYMATEMGKRSQVMPGFKELQLDNTPMRRLGEPREFARAVLYLVSDDAAYMTGHNLVLDGGYTAW